MYVYTNTNTYMYVCMYVRMFVCVCVCIHTYIHTHSAAAKNMKAHSHQLGPVCSLILRLEAAVVASEAPTRAIQLSDDSRWKADRLTRFVKSAATCKVNMTCV